MTRTALTIIAATLVTVTYTIAGQAILGGKRVKPVDTVTQKKNLKRRSCQAANRRPGRRMLLVH